MQARKANLSKGRHGIGGAQHNEAIYHVGGRILVFTVVGGSAACRGWLQIAVSDVHTHANGHSLSPTRRQSASIFQHTRSSPRTLDKSSVSKSSTGSYLEEQVS